MKVQDLITKLQQLDPSTEIVGCCEDLPGLETDRGFRLFDIDAVTAQEAERMRLDDGTPYLKLGKSELSTRLGLLELTADF